MDAKCERLMEQLIVQAIKDRVVGSKISTVAGILGIAAVSTSYLTGLVAPKWQPLLSTAGVVVSGVAAILAHDKQTASQGENDADRGSL